MRKYIVILLSIFFLSNGTTAQEELIVNVKNRKTVSLGGYWKYIVDPYENGYYDYRYRPFENRSNPGKGAFFTNAKREGKADLVEYDFDKMDSLLIPGDWNSQKEKLYYYEGTVWLKKSFDYERSKIDNRVFIYFEAVNYQADVYLNGKKLGMHVGGFTPFNFEVTDLLKDTDNFLIVKVDNKRKKEGVPTLNTDWWNYGGITRDVSIVEVPTTFIKDFFVQLNPNDSKKISAEIELDGRLGSGEKVEVSIPALQLSESLITDAEGMASCDLHSTGIRYWSIEDPYLYDVIISTDVDTVIDQIGFRTISTDGSKILLNGQPVFLKGISIHEESPISGGRGHTIEDATTLLTWAQEMGCNYVRLAHYPHSENMVRLADQMGMLVWEENPVYWTISWEDESTYANAENQLSEVIARDRNRASVIIWSMANETPTSEARNKFLIDLATFTRKRDPTRLISAALEQSDYKSNPKVRTISDSFAKHVDVLSFNQYIGWYDGGIEKCRDISWNIEYDKPVIVSEFGAGAKYGLHGERDDRWTEEYQEYLYEEILLMISTIDQLAGVSPWILVDFKSPRRVLPEIQDGWNRKGLISEKGQRKKAYYILQKFYSEIER